jgi:beta-mannosidase
MVWQDFLSACAAYSEEEPLRSEIAAEVEDNVRRLMPHPSLVLWNGGNENLWGFADWGWQPRLDGRSWGLGYYTDLLPGIVTALDAGRPYSAGSPWSVHPDQHPNDPRRGTTHIWDVWNEVDYTAYLAYRPRFVAEFGWQGAPTWSTLRRAVSDEPLTPESPGMLAHQKAAKGNDKLTAGLVPHLRVPDDMATGTGR